MSGTEIVVESKRKINAVNAGTRQLPNEILAKIFKYACPAIDFDKRIVCRGTSDCLVDYWFDDDQPTTDREFRAYGSGPPKKPARFSPTYLGAVSSRWRHIAWSTPQLWTSKVVKFDKKTDAARQLDILRLYCTNVGTMPLEIELDLRPLKRKEILQAVSELLFTHLCQKLHLLRIRGAPNAWTPLFSNVAFPYLQELSIGWEWSYGPLPFSFGIPGAILQQPPIIPLSIRILHLHHVRASVCANILLLSPWIEELYCYSCKDDAEEDEEEVWLKARHTNLNLKKFGWHFLPNSDWNEAILAYLVLPNLESFMLSGLHTISSDEEALEFLYEFLMSHSSSLKTLELSGLIDRIQVWRDSDRIIHAMSCLPRVETLRITSCSEDFIRSFIPFLEENVDFGPARLTREAKPEGIILPRLREVVFKHVLRPCDDYSLYYIAGEFATMLEERKKFSNMTYMRWEWSGHGIYWDDDDAVASFKRLADQGVKVEVVENGKVLDLFRIANLHTAASDGSDEDDDDDIPEVDSFEIED
ncbi:hypothetical protein NP233_g362 [Leucocoprinus birnbaumii]|uniref:F-box domain-containing protein n=1 Tax=Leucocoprinus birnbaumii TaxID=56174 RepID=A0AAD5W6X1_9AGAR|nr:hypothetical protein NP233_g362 [Leucocoprinus birnbaumii]